MLFSTIDQGIFLLSDLPLVISMALNMNDHVRHIFLYFIPINSCLCDVYIVQFRAVAWNTVPGDLQVSSTKWRSLVAEHLLTRVASWFLLTHMRAACRNRHHDPSLSQTSSRQRLSLDRLVLPETPTTLSVVCWETHNGILHRFSDEIALHGVKNKRVDSPDTQSTTQKLEALNPN